MYRTHYNQIFSEKPSTFNNAQRAILSNVGRYFYGIYRLGCVFRY